MELKNLLTDFYRRKLWRYQKITEYILIFVVLMLSISSLLGWSYDIIPYPLNNFNNLLFSLSLALLTLVFTIVFYELIVPKSGTRFVTALSGIFYVGTVLATILLTNGILSPYFFLCYLSFITSSFMISLSTAVAFIIEELIILWFFILTKQSYLLTTSEGLSVIFSRMLGLLIFFVYAFFTAREVIKQEEEVEEIVSLANRIEDERKTVTQLLEHQRVIDKEKNEFIALSSHSLRSPVVQLRGGAEVLTSETINRLSSDGQHFINEIVINVNRLESLVEGMLLASSLDQEQLQLFLEPAQLGTIAQSVYDQYLPQAKEYNLDFNLHLPTVDLPLIKLDKLRMKQALVALVDNAFKFTKKGQITITIEAKGSAVILQVSDTGIGMDEKKVKEIFSKFQRASNVMQGAYEYTGVGLGLYAVKLIIDAHKASIKVDSEIDKGTEFKIKFPLDN